MTNAYALIVTYQPDEFILLDLILRLEKQVQRILVIDNASPLPAEFLDILPANTQVIKNSENCGLAYAYNLGIQEAKRAGAELVILFDQDSLPSKTMVAQLSQALAQLSGQGAPVAAVGPSYLDIKGAKGFFVRKGRLRLQRIFTQQTDAPVPVDHLISSGTLINLSCYNQIGPFTESLFIDYVDTEWCLRARARGYALYGIPWAAMCHDLGSERIAVFGRSVMLHAPFRSYYIVRNGLWLLRQPWVGWNWRLIDGRRLCQLAGALALLPANRWQHICAMARGLVDGLRGRMGRARR